MLRELQDATFDDRSLHQQANPACCVAGVTDRIWCVEQSDAAESRRELLLLWMYGREQVEHEETYIHKEPDNNY
jgi:hypothetical protein